MRISDWSSDVCSSDLRRHRLGRHHGADQGLAAGALPAREGIVLPAWGFRHRAAGGGAAAVRRAAGPGADRAGAAGARLPDRAGRLCQLRSEEHTSELQSLMRISYAVFCLKKKKNTSTKDNK